MPDKPPVEKLLSIKEVAGKLGVSTKTIGRWVKERKIPYYNINGIVRFDPQIIENWVSRKAVRQKAIV